MACGVGDGGAEHESNARVLRSLGKLTLDVVCADLEDTDAIEPETEEQ